MARLRVIVHQPECPLGRLGSVWSGLGCDLEVIEAWHQPVPESIGNADALVVMGGTQNCLDDHIWGWLPSVRRLIRSTVASATPFLGVCLGLQLATVALGGRVHRSDHLTMGMTPVGLLEAGRDDPLVGGLDGADVVHFNDDAAVRLPPGAELLAVDPSGQPQVIQFAERAWGVQFHPEADKAIFDGWIDHSAASGWQERAPMSAAIAASCQVGEAEPSLDQAAQDLGARFLHLLEAPARVRVA